MKRFLLVCGFALCLAACGKLDMAEAGHRNNVDTMQELIAKAKDPSVKTALKERKAQYDKTYEALPKDEEKRIKALDALNELTYAELKKLETEVETANKQVNATLDAEVQKRLSLMVGTWKGAAMTLTIFRNGKVEYERKKGSTSKRLSGATITEVTTDKFVTSLLGIKTNFKLDKPAHVSDGFWSMTVDGVRLRQISGPNGEPPMGTFTCKELVKNHCEQHASSFAGDVAQIGMSFKTPKVPKGTATYHIKWMIEDVGKEAKPETLIDDATTKVDNTEGKAEWIALHTTIRKAGKKWPPGKYRVEVWHDKDKVATAPFSIE